MAKYTVPWSSLSIVAAMSGLVMTMGGLIDWHYRIFITEGKPRRMAMDYFDNVLAERDVKITGSIYRQQLKSDK
jgi:hypothetical protein